MTAAKIKRDTLNLRMKRGDRDLIDRAARVGGKTRTDFIMDAARRAAEEALLDQTTFHASAKDFQKIMDWLDAEPTQAETSGMERLLNAKSPWPRD